MIKAYLDKGIIAAGSFYALWILGIVSFLESAFLPIPVDPFALPVMLSNRRRLWQAALVASLASVAGGCVGYVIGATFIETFGAWIIGSYGLEEPFETFKTNLNDRGFWMIAIAAISPIPYKLGAIAAGAVHYSFPMFLLISIVCRTFRFFAIASAVYLLGPSFERFLKDQSGIATTVVVTVTIAGFLALYLI